MEAEIQTAEPHNDRDRRGEATGELSKPCELKSSDLSQYVDAWQYFSCGSEVLRDSSLTEEPTSAFRAGKRAVFRDRWQKPDSVQEDTLLSEAAGKHGVDFIDDEHSGGLRSKRQQTSSCLRWADRPCSRGQNPSIPNGDARRARPC